MAKRSNIRRRGNRFEVYFRNEGKQHSKSYRTLDEARLYLAQSQARKIRGEFRAPVKMRFRDFAAEWLRDYAQPHVSPRTFDGYEGALRVHLLPFFGEAFLTDINRKAIDAFVADWKAGGPW